MKEISDAVNAQLRGDGIVDMFLEGHSLDVKLEQFSVKQNHNTDQVMAYTGSVELPFDYKGQEPLLEGTKARLVLAVHNWDSLSPDQIPALFREKGQISFSIYRESPDKPLYSLAAQFGKEGGKVKGDQDFIAQAYELIYEGKDGPAD